VVRPIAYVLNAAWPEAIKHEREIAPLGHSCRPLPNGWCNAGAAVQNKNGWVWTGSDWLIHLVGRTASGWPNISWAHHDRLCRATCRDRLD
jgi:hypothetical protein